MGWNINTITISGRCGCPQAKPNPELRYTQGGMAVCTIPMAVDIWNKNKKDNDTYFIKCTFWGTDAEKAAGQIWSGITFVVQGRLQENQWTAQDGSLVKEKLINVQQWQVCPRTESGNGGSVATGRPAQSRPAVAAEDYDIGDLGPPLDMDDH